MPNSPPTFLELESGFATCPILRLDVCGREDAKQRKVLSSQDEPRVSCTAPRSLRIAQCRMMGAAASFSCILSGAGSFHPRISKAGQVPNEWIFRRHHEASSSPPTISSLELGCCGNTPLVGWCHEGLSRSLLSRPTPEPARQKAKE